VSFAAPPFPGRFEVRGKWKVGLLALVALIDLNTPVFAQYPQKVVRWIVTMPPGGANDILVRPLAQRLSEAMGQQVLVDNRSGAGGMIGAEAAARAAPDGYTLVALTLGHAIGASLYKKINFDLLGDFAPVTLLAASAPVLVVPPALPVKSVKDLIALAKARPGELIYGSSGNGTPPHLAAELFIHMTRTKMTHVPYKGGGPSIVALLGGEIMLSFASLPPAVPHIRSGRLNALGVASGQRVPSLPQIPTISEAGVAGYAADIWYGLSVPAATPQDIVARLHADMTKILKQADVVQLLEKAGFQARTSTPEEYGALMRRELEKWATVVKAAGMRAD
jgi:tripartite-type tricarboxylate transporter receptor subunit TctC